MSEQQDRYRRFEEELTKFAEDVIQLCKKLPHDNVNNILISQGVRSASSIGANYREANECISKKDFLYRLRISRKEAKETDHWFKLMLSANSNFKADIEILIDKNNKYRNIFSKMIFNTVQK